MSCSVHMISKWPIKKLGEVCDVLDSKRKPITQRDRVAGEYPYYGATGTLDHVKDYIFNEKLILVGEDGAKWGAGESTAFIADGKFWVNNHAHVIRPHRNEILDNWIVYFLNVSDLSKYITGLTVQKLNQGKLREIEIPTPSLFEQRRILKTLDSIFEKVSLAKQNAEKNLQNSRELFESYSEKVFTNPKEGWEEKELGEIAEVEYGFTEKAKSSGDFRYIRITDIDKNGNLEPKNKMYVKNTKESREYILKDGDLLMARTGASFADVLLYEDIEPSIFASYLIKIVFKEKILNKFYWYFSKSKTYWDQARRLSSGSAQPQFNGAALKQVIFAYPKSVSEQRSIVSKLDALSAETKKLEAIYAQKLADLEELKKSVLKKAFSGEL